MNDDTRAPVSYSMKPFATVMLFFPHEGTGGDCSPTDYISKNKARQERFRDYNLKEKRRRKGRKEEGQKTN